MRGHGRGSDEGRPPRLAAWLLERLLPMDDREMVTGDLEEEFRARGGGRLWYWRQAVTIGLRIRSSAGVPDAPAREIRLALRRLLREPGYTAVAVLAIALGVGLNAGILVVAHEVLFAPLPYPDAARLAVVTNDHSGSSTGGFGVSWLNMRDVMERSRTLEEASLFVDWQDVTWTGPDATHRIPASFVDRSYFRLLGLRTGLGRPLAQDENRPGSPGRVAVLGRGSWQRLFGADPTVVGRTVSLNGRPYEIVGVLEDDRGDLRYRWNADPAGIFLPLFAVEDLVGFDLRERRGMRAANALVKVRADVTTDDAHEELRGISAGLAAEFPVDNQGWRYRVQALDDAFYEDLRTPAAALLAGSVLVLLLVGVNLVTLLLIRSTGQSTEFAVRRALGAGAGRLTRQLMAEGLVLAALGGALGLLLATGALEAARGAVGAEFPAFVELRLDWSVVLVSGAACLALGCALGLVPALGALGGDRIGALRGGRAHSADRGTRAVQGGLVAGEVALAFVLLVGAGLMLESFRTLRGTGYGFDTGNLVIARTALQGDRYAGPDGRRAFVEALVDGARALPGATDAFLWSPNELGSGNQVEILAAEGRWDAHPEERIEASLHALRPGTLGAMGLPLLEGRDVAPSDGPDSPPVALVSESLARALWPGEAAVGRNVETPEDGQLLQYRVIGVVADARHRTRLVEPFGPQLDVYVAFDQEPRAALTLAVRTGPDADPAAVATEVRGLVRGLDPGLPLHEVTTMEARMRDEESRARLTAVLVAAYAGLAVALAALGVYGVLAHSVRRRVGEIGIRMALGADRGRVLRRVVGGGMGLAIGGTVLGLGIAVAGSGLLADALYRVEPRDPVVYGAVALILGLVALGATLVPGLRATRIQPSRALREG